MLQNQISYLVIVAPLLFVLTAIASWFQSGLNPAFIKRLSVFSTVTSILISVVISAVLITTGNFDTVFHEYNGLGFSLRFDAVSLIMFTMVCIIAFVVMKFSFNYLDGDHRHGAFLGRLAAAIASVQLLVLSGNLLLMFLSWVVTSVSLHRLLLFYPNRVGAMIAARKKFIVARISDLCLGISIYLIYSSFGTGDLSTIFNAINSAEFQQLSTELEAATIFLALAAMFKSAQLPSHGWLIEVMETPTPVSALLHAGLLNAGPFLIIRMSFLFTNAVYAPFLLILIGGLTAAFGTVVFMTQTSVKTALSYSSIGHMGFSLMVCGFGAYPAAMLHLVAHSFYKAHSFLSSGSVIDMIRSSYFTHSKRTGNYWKISLGYLMTLLLVIPVFYLLHLGELKHLPLLFITLIIAMSMARLLISALDNQSGTTLVWRAITMVVLTVTSFVVLESISSYSLGTSIPQLTAPSLSEIILMMFLLVTFLMVIFIQIQAPLWNNHPRFQSLAIHIRNGLYINAVFDRMIGAWKIETPEFSIQDEEVNNAISSEYQFQYQNQS